MLRFIRSRYARLGLQRRIMLYVSAGLVVCSAVYALVALQAIQQSTDLVFHERLIVAGTIAHEVDDDLAHMDQELAAAGEAASPALAAHQTDAALAPLQALYQHWELFHGLTGRCVILVTDPQGRVTLSEPAGGEPVGHNLFQDARLRDAIQSARAAMLDDTAPDQSGNPTVAIVAPVRSGTRTDGFLVAEIDRAHIGAELTSWLRLGESGYGVELLDASGHVIISSDRPVPSTSRHWPLVAPYWPAGKSGVTMHSVEVNGENEDHVIAFAPLTRIRWGVVVEQPTDEALILPRNLESRFAVFGLAALLGGLALAWVTTRRVVKPVNALIDASQEIAAGNLDHPLDVSGADEIATLARSFDEMRARLQGSHAEIARWNRELEARVRQRTHELSALVESSHALTSTLDLDALFGILTQQAREVLPSAEGIVLFLLDGESPHLVVRSAYGFDAAQCVQLRFGTGEAIGGRVFETQKPVLLQTAAEVDEAQANLSEENQRHFLEAVGDRRVSSAAGVPLMAKGTRLGALVLYNFSREAAFADSDMPVLQALADQAAAAIENAQLYAALQAKEAARTQLLEKVIEAQEEERQRVAREIHDELGQLLTRLSINLKMCESHVPAHLTEATQNLAATQTLVWQTIEEAHRLIVELRPTLLDELGLEAALREEMAQRLAPLGVETALSADGALERLPAPVGITVFRIAQEAITNVARHAHARRASLSLRRGGGELQVLIQDDGVGLPADWGTRADGHRPLGLLGMRERAALLGGTLTIEPCPPHGTRLFLRVPLDAAAVPT
jgi:signal transduction histidine kinase